MHIPLSRRNRSEEHTSELQSLTNLVCRLLLEKKKISRRAIGASVCRKKAFSFFLRNEQGHLQQESQYNNPCQPPEMYFFLKNKEATEFNTLPYPVPLLI